MQVQNGGLPDQIEWKNIKYTFKQRFPRKLFTNFIAILFIAFAFWAVREIKITMEQQKKALNLNDCQEIDLEMRYNFHATNKNATLSFDDFYMQEAYNRFKPEFEANGSSAIENTLDLKCFCNYKFESDKIDFIWIDFSKVAESSNNLCMSFYWKFNFKSIIVIASGSTIAVLNVVVIVVS